MQLNGYKGLTSVNVDILPYGFIFFEIFKEVLVLPVKDA